MLRWMRAMPTMEFATREVRVDFAVEGLIQTAKVGALVAAGGTGKTTLLRFLDRDTPPIEATAAPQAAVALAS